MAPHRLEGTVTCLWRAGALLGEGPCWDPRLGRLVFLDIKGRRVHAFSPATGARQSWETDGRICSLDVPGAGWVAPEGLGATPYLSTGDAGFAWLSLDGETPRLLPIAHPEAHLTENRFNDGKSGPDGRYWAGTMHDPETHATGTLYAFAPEIDAVALDGGYRVTNGPAFAPDGRTVYHNDSALQTVYAFDLDGEGRLANKRVLVRFGEGEGYPDGMTTDAEGNLWIAMWDGWRVEKVSSSGERLGAVSIPAARVTSCVFGGEDGRTLFVTSARIGCSETDDPLAGALFAVRLAE
jgi:D-xylonolactonase